MPPRRSKRLRHGSVVERGPSPSEEATPVQTGCLSLLPVEVIAEVLEWVGDRGFQGITGLAPARLVSRKWQQALGELLEKRVEQPRHSFSWGNTNTRLRRSTVRLALLSLPFMSNTFLEHCDSIDLPIAADDRVFELLSVVPRLDTLFANRLQLREKGVAACSKLRFLASVFLSTPNVLTLEDLKGLGRLRRLSELNIEDCADVAVDGLQYLSRCSRLTSLAWKRSSITDAALEAIASIPALRTLELDRCWLLTDAGLGHLMSKGVKLTKLILNSCPLITDMGVISLANQPDSQLETLDLSSLNLTDEGIKALARLRKLTDLTVYDCSNLSDEGFQHLLQHVSLRRLSLHFVPKVSDRTIDALCKPPCGELQSIVLERSLGITDLSLERLSHVRTLTYVSLSDLPRVTDIGIRSLAKLPRRCSVNINDLPLVTKASMKAIRRKRPF
jgi:hypothetical protein